MADTDTGKMCTEPNGNLHGSFSLKSMNTSKNSFQALFSSFFLTVCQCEHHKSEHTKTLRCTKLLESSFSFATIRIVHSSYVLSVFIVAERKGVQNVQISLLSSAKDLITFGPDDIPGNTVCLRFDAKYDVVEALMMTLGMDKCARHTQVCKFRSL